MNGTTGYDAPVEIGGLFVDPPGASRCRDLAAAAGFTPEPMSGRGTQGRCGHGHNFGSELARAHRAVVSATGVDHPALPGM